VRRKTHTSGTGTRTATGIGAAELQGRQRASQRGFYRALGGASPDARLVELDGGVQATVVPVRPWFSVFNAVHYDDPAALAAGLEDLSRVYEDAGVRSWSVWVAPAERNGPGIVADAGFALESNPQRMAAPIAEIDLEQRREIELVEEPTWEMVVACNDRAHGVLAEWSMRPVFSHVRDPTLRVHALRCDGDLAAALIAREEDGDCYLWFVATVPEAQRRGLGAELVRHALREAAARGATTTSLESTVVGERLYESLGYRAMGRFGVWVRR
jgi:ribosomal protein S18 acetylase RimI-like enzyme